MTPRLERSTFLGRGAASRMGMSVAALSLLWLALAYVLGWFG